MSNATEWSNGINGVTRVLGYTVRTLVLIHVRLVEPCNESSNQASTLDPYLLWRALACIRPGLPTAVACTVHVCPIYAAASNPNGEL